MADIAAQPLSLLLHFTNMESSLVIQSFFSRKLCKPVNFCIPDEIDYVLNVGNE